ncbi:MAG TPA: hypothetical protein ENI69_09610, partial [Rhodospirillales bacterium]|nr:hypothetical protein [Rhodospirillales bacterium]
GGLVITYSGELYNYRELRHKLKSQGSVFSSESDTEVVLEAYRVWGIDCLQSFNGMFAFASEYKALFCLEGIAPHVDETRLLDFLDTPAHGVDDRRQTLFTGISQLAPGEYLLLDLNDLSWQATSYWTPDTGRTQKMSFTDAAERLRWLLTESVSLRLRSDVPVGSCLSGGLDSGSIACLSRQLFGPDQAYHVFTGRFPGSTADEGPWASKITQAADLSSHQTVPGADGLLGDMADFIWLNELPVDSASQYGQWCVYRLAAENGVTVLLDGQGGDEILAGYEQYFAPYLASQRRQGKVVTAEQQAIRERYPQALAVADQRWKHKLPWSLRLALARITNRGSDMAFGVAPEFAASLVAGRTQDSIADDLHAVLRRDRYGYLTTLLRYGDRNSMAHSREVRMPFCDHRISELVATLPPDYLMGNGETKRLLRQAMSGILPEPVRQRWNKQGFLPPQADWMRNDLGHAVEDLFHQSSFAERGIWHAPWWRKALARVRNGDDALATNVWKPFIDEMWRRHFIDRVKSMPQLPPLCERAS